MKMQDLFEPVQKIWEALPDSVRAAIISGILALLRLMYADKAKKGTRRFLEVGMCMTLTWASSKFIGLFGLSEDATWLIAVALGWWGTDYVKERAKSIIFKRVDGNESDQNNKSD